MKKKRKSKRDNKKLSNKNIETPQNKNNKTVKKKSLFKKVFSCILVILSIWSVFLTTWVVFNPNVSVEPSVLLDPNNPAYTVFTVHNQGYFNIYDVKFSCSIKYLKLPGNIHVVGLGEYTNSFSDPKQVATVIAAGKKYSELLPLTGMKHNKIENADIAIVLSFRTTKWFPWQRKTLHRFVATKGKDKKWYWLPQPIKK